MATIQTEEIMLKKNNSNILKVSSSIMMRELFLEVIMAKIFKTDTQEQALKEIVESLKIVSSLNVLLNDEEVTECKIRINGVTNSGSLNEQIPIPYAMIVPQLKDYRKKLVKEILDKSRSYSIRLDDNENEIIGIKPKKEVQTNASESMRKDEEKEENTPQPASIPQSSSGFQTGNYY